MINYRFIVSLTILLIMLFRCVPTADSHALDISDSRWYLSSEKVTATLTIGQNLILGLGPIDLDNDKLLTKDELHQAISAYVQPYIANNISVYADGRKLPMAVEYIEMINLGVVDVKLVFASAETIQAVKIECRLFTEIPLRSHSTFANIMVPHATEIIETAFTKENPVWEGSLTSSFSYWEQGTTFFILGLEHILTGYDHLLFLLALLVIGLRLKEALLVITSFTVAHSITLFLASMGIFRLDSRIVEAVIALSICYIAFENILGGPKKFRWLITFGFGLIHGFGFASVLQELVESKNNLVFTVLSFNAGIEAGQLMVFMIVMPILVLLSKRFVLKKVTSSVSILIFIMGLIWVMERLLNFSILGV